MKLNLNLILSAIAAVASSALLDWREMAGVVLLFLSVLLWERARVEAWTKNQKERRISEEARHIEKVARLEADLKARTPGQGGKRS